MKEDDFQGLGPSGKTVDQDDAQGRSRRQSSEFGLAVLIMAAFALGALRRRLARPNDELHSQRARSFLRWSWKETPSNGERPRQTQRAWDDYFQEELGKERIKRMHQAFDRAKACNTRSYEKWEEHPGDPESDWDARNSASQISPVLRKAHILRHYEVLGLDPERQTPYSEAELKAAFRNKAKLHHPDRNIAWKEESEQKFREVMESYEALRAPHKSK